MTRRPTMLVLAFASLTLVACPTPARATVELAFLNVPGQPGATGGIELACSQPDSAYRLFLAFSSDEAIPDFIGVAVDMRIAYDTGRQPPPPLSPFWHFEEGGCNAGALRVTAALPSEYAGTSSAWGPYPWNTANVTTLYSSDHPAQGAGILAIEALGRLPGALEAGVTYFALMFELQTCSAGACEGCDELMGVLVVNLALLRSGGGGVNLGGSTFPVCFNFSGGCPVIDARGHGPETVTLMPASARPVPRLDGPCGPTPTLDHSWGALKIRYR